MCLYELTSSFLWDLSAPLYGHHRPNNGTSFLFYGDFRAWCRWTPILFHFVASWPFLVWLQTPIMRTLNWQGSGRRAISSGVQPAWVPTALRQELTMAMWRSQLSLLIPMDHTMELSFFLTVGEGRMRDWESQVIKNFSPLTQGTWWHWLPVPLAQCERENKGLNTGLPGVSCPGGRSWGPGLGRSVEQMQREV